MAFCIDILEYYYQMDELSNLRSGINDIDSQIFSLLLQRLGLVYNISEIKKKQNLPIYDKEREENIYNRIDAHYQGRNGLYIKDIYKTIMNESKRIQSENN